MKTAACVLASLSCASIADAKGQQPNVILVLTDDQGYGNMSCTGNEFAPDLLQAPDKPMTSALYLKVRKL